MKDLEKNIKNLRNTLDRAKKLVNRIKNENSGWISLGVDNEDLKNAIELLNVIEENLVLLSDSIWEIPSEIAGDEQKTALVNEGINLTFSDLNAIYGDVKHIRKDIESGREQRHNVKHLDAHFTLFENHILRIKKRLDTILLAS
jgi:archaellum component FlaC